MSKPVNIFVAGWLAAFAPIHFERGNVGWVAVFLLLSILNLYAGMRR
jgi:hypothetical protein